MTLENFFSLAGLAAVMTGGVGSIMLMLIRGIIAQEKSHLATEFDRIDTAAADHEARLRRVEAVVSECVRRTDLEQLRRDLEQRLDRMTELLTEPRRAKVRR